VLGSVLPETHRDVVLADLDEEFAERVAASRSGGASARWYWRQVIASLPGATRMRIRFQVNDLLRDLQYGVRLLRRKPAFSATAMLTLAIGVGATTAVLTLANAVLVRPLPYPDPDQIVSILEIDRARDATSGNLSWPDLIDYSRQNQTLSAMAAYIGGSRTLTANQAAADRVSAALVTGQFFNVLGVAPAIGRAIADDDIPESAPPVAMITDASWRTRFGGDPSVIGRRVTVNDVTTTIIGVLPADFQFPPRGQAELWLPVRVDQDVIERRPYHWLNAIGRVKPGITRAQAQDDLDRIARGFTALDPRSHPTPGVLAPRLRDRIVGDVRPTLLILSVASILVLLVACANIAGLLLAQHATRTSEIAVRSVMGAGRSRLFRQLLIENVALSVPGGVLGVVIGQGMIRGLVATMPQTQRLNLPHMTTLSLDGQALAISLVITLSASLLFGLLPAWRTARSDQRQPSRGVAGLGTRELRLQSAFVVIQVALALVLLAGAGLMAQSLRRLLNVSPGFRTDHLLTMTVAPPDGRYSEPPAVAAFYRTLIERVRALPGVRDASIIDHLPLNGNGNTTAIVIAGDPGSRETTTVIRQTGANYFGVMGIPVEEGRAFTAADQATSPRVAMVNRALASRLGGAVVGTRISLTVRRAVEIEVVGIVGNERFGALDAETDPVLYFPQTQGFGADYSLVVRTMGAPATMTPAVVSAIHEIDPSIPLYSRLTMDEILDRSDAVFRRRSVLTLIGGFAIAALLLASVGLYGVLTQVVAQRTREIGVRLALGAGTAAIAGDILRRALTPVALGLLIGLGGSLLAGPYLGAMLYGTRATDPVTLVVVSVALGLAALVACVVPARRALSVDPVTALRDG